MPEAVDVHLLQAFAPAPELEACVSRDRDRPLAVQIALYR